MLFLAVEFALLVCPVFSWIAIYSSLQHKLLPPVYTACGIVLALAFAMSLFGLDWRWEDANALTPPVVWGCLMLLGGSIVYLPYGRIRALLGMVFIFISSITALVAVVGVLGIALVSGRTSNEDKIILPTGEKVLLSRSGNALDDFRLTIIEKYRPIPFTPFMKPAWRHVFTDESVFYGDKGFSMELINGKERQIFWANGKTKYNLRECGAPFYRKKHKDCRMISTTRYRVVLD